MKWLPFERLPLGSRAKPDAPASMAQMLAKGMPEARRLMQHHQALKREMRGNFLAPLAEPRVILHVGCINGRWAMEIAQQFPGARVVGIDAIAPAPFLNLGNGIEQKPPNVDLLQGDITQSLPFSDAAFDFVYARFIYTNVVEQAWEPLLRELARVTRPGGWLELMEPLPYAVQQREGMTTIFRWFNDCLRQQGYAPLVALKLSTMLKSAGFDAIATTQFGQQATNVPLGPELAVQRQNALEFVDLMRVPLVEAGVTSAAEYDHVAASAQNEVKSQATLDSFVTYVNYAQRQA